MNKVIENIKSSFFRESDNKTLREDKVFCMMPWVHLHVTQYGTVMPCCQASPWDEPHSFGNINKQTISEIWNGEKIKEFRKKMMNSQPDYRCAKCYHLEKSQVLSLRQVVNRLYEHKYHLVEATDAEGYSPDTFPVYWDIRFSNLCNFRCRICGPWSSSRWYDDAKKLGEAGDNKPLTQAVENPESVFSQLEENIGSVEEIYFAGGEPLLMEEHYKMLDLLQKHGRFDVLLRYNTNFSEFTFKDRSVFDTWKKFNNVLVMASLDDSGKRGEIQRKGQKWDDALRLRKEMMAVCPNVHFSLSPTISVLNAFSLPGFHREWSELGLVGAIDIWPTVLEHPDIYNITIFPKQMKMELRKIYKAHAEWMKSMKTEDAQLREHVANSFLKVIEYMESEDNSALIPKLVERCLKLDELRQESTFENLPELKPLLEMAKAKQPQK